MRTATEGGTVLQMAASQAEVNVPKIERVKKCGEIGRGAYGVIFRGEWQGSSCAIKEIHEIFTTASISEDDRLRARSAFQKECSQSIRLRHPNIVQFFGLYEGGQGFASLVMELLHCSLHHLLEPPEKDKKPLAMPMEIKLSLLCDITRGLRYLHNHSPYIIHRDLSSNNVLVTEGMVAKIGDLGTIRFFDPKRQSQMSKQPGTVVFMPPEALIETPDYGRDIDIFSFACVALHTLSGKWPTPTEPVKVQQGGATDLIAVSEANRRIQYLKEIGDKDMKELLVRCLNNDRHKRPNIIVVYDEVHAILAKIPNELPLTKLHAYLTIQESADRIKQLGDDATVRGERIDEMQKVITEKEGEIDKLQKELTNRDERIQQQGAEMQRQADEIKRLEADIVRKNEEICRCNQEIASQQTTINELSAKLPSVDLMQLDEKSTNYWEGLKTTWSKVADLPVKLMSCCAVEMDGDVYISGRSQSTHFINVLHYSQADNSWSILNHLPCTHSSLAVVRSKSQLIAVGGIYAEIGDDDNLEGDIPTKVLGKVLTWDAQMECWVNAYPDMPTARCSSTAVGHGSTIIVAGGVTGWEPAIISTSVVEVMTVNEIPLRSEWTTVQSLPYPSSFALPMIVGDQLYIASGYSGDKTTCGVLTANVSKLVTSKKDDTIFVWEKMSDLPHDSLSVGECDGRLVVFGGRRKSGTLEDGQLQYKVVSPIHLYNAETDTWDYVGHVPKEYCYWLGCAVCLEENKLLFVGGANDPNERSHDVYLSTCALLTVTK